MKLKALPGTRIRLDHTLAFTGLLLAFQLIVQTNAVFAILVACFIVLTALTVNSLGGAITVPGFSVMAMALKIVVISQVAKVFFLQPADQYLDAPVATISVLCVGMAGVLLAAVTSSALRTNRKVFQRTINPHHLLGIAIVAYVIGTLTYITIQLTSYNVYGNFKVGGFLGIARQISMVHPLSVICSTAFYILRSGKRKSVGVFSVIAILTQLIFGLLGTNKLLMYEPFLYYFLTCIAFGFRLRGRHVISALLAGAIAVKVLFPIAQVGRSFTRSISLTDNIRLTQEFLKNNNLTTLQEQLESKAQYESQYQYYGRNVGLLERFSLIEQVDELVNVTLHEGTIGWETVTHGFKMMLPRFFYPEKPTGNTANLLGRRIGSIGDEDESTQIAFGFIGEAFAVFSWLGAFLIPFAWTFAFFVVYQNLVPSLYFSVWTVFLMGFFQHTFVEATISSMTLFILQLPFVLFFLYVALRQLGSFLTPALKALLPLSRQRPAPVVQDNTYLEPDLPRYALNQTEMGRLR